MDREVNKLSGGELQRFAIATTCVQKADVSLGKFTSCVYAKLSLGLHV
jgi:translation initiation factor RLI1